MQQTKIVINRFVATLMFIGISHCLISQNIDISLLRKINLHRNESLDPTFKILSNSVTPLVIAVPIGFITTGFINKDSIIKSKAAVLCLSGMMASVLTTSLKYTISRDRPFLTYPDIQKGDKGRSKSFPSGHTSAAFSLATSLSIAYPKWYVVAPCFIWASSVAYSRMALGLHYPSDVLVGALIGSGSAYLSTMLNNWYYKRQ